MTGQTDLLDELVTVDGRRVVDVGCGDGWLVRRVAARGAIAVGVEPGAAALAAARAASPVAAERYVEGRAEMLPLPADSADVVLFFNSLHHVPVEHMGDALGEALRVCRRGGLVFVQEPLAEGPLFELMRPLSDETADRAAAQDALRRAAGWPGVTVFQHAFTPVARVASFEAWSEHQVLVDAERAPGLRAAERELRARFHALGRADGDGWSFAAPARVTLLRRGMR